MEAMACGVTVVGSDSGEIPRVIGEAGLVFPENDVGALGAHLVALQRNAEWRRALGCRGRERVLANYSHRTIAERIRAMYEQLMAP